MRIILRKYCMISVTLFWHIIHTSPFLYVSNGSNPSPGLGMLTVYVIDVATNSVVTVVDVGTPIFFNGLAITPDGKTAYVSCANNLNQGFIARIDIASNTHILPDIPVSELPGAIGISPNGLYAYVPCQDGNLNRINIAQNVVDAMINFSSSSLEVLDMTIAPNGLTAYISATSQLVPVDLVTNTVGTPVTLNNPAQGSAITPDNNYLYVATENSFIVQFNVMNRLAPTPTGVTISLPVVFSDPDPQSLAITVNNGQTYLYATDDNNNTFTPINISDPTNPIIGNPLSTDSRPWVIVITPDGTAAYVGNNGTNTLTEFNITNPMTPIQQASITIGNGPSGMAITPMVLVPSGSKTKNTFLLQTDFINTITWAPQIQIYPIAAYNIYRDVALTQLIATVPASGPLQYSDHDRSPNTVYTYYIAAVDIFGNIYAPISISL